MGSTDLSTLEERLPATAASLAVARAVMRDFTAELGVDVCGVELAVSEAVADAVVHDGGDVELTARSSPRALEVVIRDRRDGDAPPVGERIAIIRRLVHDVGVADGSGGHALTLRFRRLGRG
jgi:anti-sigma regulatory factor (Ser/Thr protein kinase)